ncbi:putative membrane protein [Handroanthus impetiginosus]|uniref:Putative membrane protein n=1 Tax=Handroanthus impetiginosus TaxID=429701 RepID=A0A2G9GIF4_9LAMI|nr:putative membrane protein [Handroanthus impetiginosus]
MSNPNITLSIASAQNITDPPVRTKIGRISEWYSSGSAGCNSFWREAALVVPSVLLVLYLGFQARRNLKKLSHRKSHVMIAYYALLWFSALLNLAWSLLQGWQCEPGKTIAWNLLSLFTECGMLSLEISIVAFLLQENYAGGLEALAHTFLVSGSFVAVDILVQAIFIFGFGVPLFVNTDGTHLGKWSILFIHTLALTAVYCYILFVHYSKWRDKLPPRPSFYNYAVVMFIINVMGLFASGLAGIGFGLGLWLYNFVTICRHSLYLPFLYVTFLADFFQEEDWLLDNAYYSEMKDAGFFDTEWD